MNINPYAPVNTYGEAGTRGLLHVLAVPAIMTIRILTVLYGAWFAYFILPNLFDNVRNGVPAAIFLLPFFTIVCYGILAVAIPVLRLRKLQFAWRYLAIATPLVILFAITWELATIEIAPNEYLSLAATASLYFPAIVCNLLLWRRAHDYTEPSIPKTM